MDLVETELCDYLQVRHTKLEPVQDSGSSSPPKVIGAKPDVPSKFYKVENRRFIDSTPLIVRKLYKVS